MTVPHLGPRRALSLDTDSATAVEGVSSASFREVMSSFPTGVTVITTITEDGTPVGLTANAVSSVSLTPPQLLICVGKERFTAKAINSHQAFAVNFLDRTQLHIAQRFASRAPDKFSGIAIRRGWKQLPVITGALAFAECEVQKTMEVGDHFIFVGLVMRGDAAAGEPLMFFRREYAGWPTQGRDGPEVEGSGR